MKYVLDVHTHTLASGHAYNTIREMAAAARDHGLELLGITEHGMAMPGACHSYYFENTKMLPREMEGIEVLFGVEANIMDVQGNLDMNEHLLQKMDLVNASMPKPTFTSGTKEENTKTYRKVMENPYVDIIGHPDDGRYPVDFDELARGAKENGVLLEINNNSLDPRCTRENGEEHVRAILKACMKYETPVVLNSDAHVDVLVGCHCYSEKLVEEMGFPESLIVNKSVCDLKKYLHKFNNL